MADLVPTRRSLHAVAELLLAGPQYAESGTIKLTPVLHGFACVASPGARVEGGDLVLGRRRGGLDGRTLAELGVELGIEPRSLADVYQDCTEMPLEQELVVEQAAADEIATALAAGERALRAFAPAAEPVLWPEHFDLGITVAEVNYGVSPGDSFLAVPYAYVGPWNTDGLTGDFWNAPFGAASPVDELDDLAGFFSRAAALVRR